MNVMAILHKTGIKMFPMFTGKNQGCIINLNLSQLTCYLRNVIQKRREKCIFILKDIIVDKKG